jgi:hypothetical protein
MHLGDSDSTSIRARRATGGGQDSLPDLVARNPPQVATGISKDVPRVRSRESTASAGFATPARPSATGDTTVDPFVRRLANAAAVERGDVQPRRTAPSPAAGPVETASLAAQAGPTPAGPSTANLVTVVSGVASTLGMSPPASGMGGSPTAPMPMLAGVLQLVRRELEQNSLNHASLTAALTSTQPNANPAIAPSTPDPADQVPTAYGDIGKWMLQSDGQISDWGGQPYDGKTLLEPVNVIIVDPTSTSPAQATVKLNAAMFWAGFPAQPIHSGGFEGTIDDVTYGQRPVLPLLGYSNNFFLLTNDHGRIFGPDPVETSAGYVWTGSFSTEEFVIYNSLPAHAYVSSHTARAALAMALIMSGQATYGGTVPLDNSYNTATTTTGDHDGYAVALVLRAPGAVEVHVGRPVRRVRSWPA